MSNEKSMILAQNVSFKYDEDADLVLNEVSLDVQKGELIAVLGANGCGKSTLAKHFNAILIPYKGVIVVEDIPTTDDERLLDIRQKVGMVFQNPDNQIVATVVEEDVAFALENLGVEPSEIRIRIDEAMKKTGIFKHKESAPHKLSGGQKQRVAIAGVIAMRPNCIVLDEATAMLDPRGRDSVLKTIRKLNTELGMTVVMITHYMEEATTADRVIVMSEGEIVLQGTPKEVFSQVDEIKKLRLDVPQATELCIELKKAGVDIPTDILSTEECVEALYNLLSKKGVE